MHEAVGTDSAQLLELVYIFVGWSSLFFHVVSCTVCFTQKLIKNWTKLTKYEERCFKGIV